MLGDIMISARVVLNEYANSGLNVVKSKFNLRDKSEALNKFIEMFGDKFVEREAKDAYIKKLLDIEEKHFKKYGKHKLSLKELDKICGIGD